MSSKFLIAAGLLAIVTMAAWADNTKEYAPTPAPTPKAAATLEDASRMVNAGDYRGAMPILTAIIQKDANNTDALNLMGFSLRKTGQTDMALQYYNRALALQPKHIGANEYLGELYAELGQIDKAKERLGILEGVCGHCSQAQELSEAIEKAQKKS